MSTRARVLAIPLSMALLKVLLHLPFLHRYHYQHDEFYFIACGQHLSFGYVDHAPLVPWIARLATTLFGESVVGLRLFALLAGALTIFLVGVLTRRLGGGRFAQLLACLAWFVAPVALRSGNLLAIPSFEPLFWVGATLMLVRILQRDRVARSWLVLGLIVGLGLLNKHSMLFFVFGLSVALVATPLRAELRTRRPWLAGAIALAIFAPNLVWQVQHGWPTASFLRGLNESVMAGISKLQFLAGQFLYLNPLAAFVWIGGLVWLFSRAGRTYRALGVLWLAVFGLLLATDSKIYYLSPAYPAIVAAGGVAWERWSAARRERTQRAWRIACLALVGLGGLSLAPVGVPMLSIDATDDFVGAVTLGKMENVYELTGDLHGMFGWPERIEAIVRVYEQIPPEERERTVILGAGYGIAGAIDYLGREQGLPPAVCLDQTYWMWGLPEREIDTVISVGYGFETLEAIWKDVEVLATVELAHVNPEDTPMLIARCREPVIPLAELWARNRSW